jgi:hypothetical protein
MSTEWFRSKTWNEAVEQYFNEKLHRARRKGGAKTSIPPGCQQYDWGARGD